MSIESTYFLPVKNLLKMYFCCSIFLGVPSTILFLEIFMTKGQIKFLIVVGLSSFLFALCMHHAIDMFFFIIREVEPLLQNKKGNEAIQSMIYKAALTDFYSTILFFSSFVLYRFVQKYENSLRYKGYFLAYMFGSLCALSVSVITLYALLVQVTPSISIYVWLIPLFFFIATTSTLLQTQKVEEKEIAERQLKLNF